MTRDFYILVGDQVPKENTAWKLYLKLLEIVQIVTSPFITKFYIKQLDEAISSHRKLYIQSYIELIKCQVSYNLTLHFDDS